MECIGYAILILGVGGAEVVRGDPAVMLFTFPDEFFAVGTDIDESGS